MLILRNANEGDVLRNLDAPRITVGRDLSNDVILDEASVSGFHAVLLCEDDTFAVADLGSTNGTVVNGRRIAGRGAFAEGDTIQFGTVALEIANSIPRRRPTVVMPVISADIGVPAATGVSLRL